VQNLGCRDRLLGWNAAQRAQGLAQVVNGVRFLVAGYAIDDSTPNRQYWDLWLKIIRKTNWSSISGS
jgi:hypothetical protein